VGGGLRSRTICARRIRALDGSRQHAPGLTRRAARSAPAVAPIERSLTTRRSLSNSPLIRSVPHSWFSREMVAIKSWTWGLRCGPPPREGDFQRQNSRLALSMPAHDRLWRYDGQMLAPVGTPATRQGPEQLVPGMKAGTRSGPEWDESAPRVDGAGVGSRARGRGAGVPRPGRS
jgi:hypothetical protein